MLRRILASLGLVSAFSIVACASSVPDVDDADGNVGSSSEPLTTADAVSRAEQWVAVKLHYCQAPNGARDYDAACSTVCSRTKNAAWDPYRSDCSGLVSWAWALPAPGRVTGQFAPFQTDITHAIPATELREGDAVNNSTHIMLFKAWITPGKRALLLEEPGCSSSQPYAREDTSDVTISGSSITVASHGETFTAIRYGALSESVKGTLDSAACDTLKGWAQDPKTPAKGIDVELSFGAAAGKPGAHTLKVLAADVRNDLCKPLGSCNHGFALPMPLGARDGRAHAVYAYGLDASGKPTTLLASAPKTITCTPPGIPTGAKGGVKRPLGDLAAWQLDAYADVAREAAVAVDAIPAGPAMGAPLAVHVAGSPDVFVVDGKLKRHIDGPSLAAWRMTATKGTADELAALADGPAWPAAPFVFEGDGSATATVFVLDVADLPGAAGEGAAPAGTPPNGQAGGEPGDSGGGCTVTRTGTGTGTWIAMALFAILWRRRRRDH